MARIRTIKPETPQSQSMGRVTREARLCFIMLWTLADDEGRLRGNSRMLASLLYPYDNDAPELIDGWLNELEREKSCTRYEIEGHQYVQINNWLDHQKIDRPTKSKHPSPPQHSKPRRRLAKPREPSSLDQGPKDQGPKEGTKDACAPRLDGLPDWVPQDQWKSYVEMRQRIRAPLTEKAKALELRELEKLRDAGDDPAAVLEQAVRKSWRGLYPLRRAPPSNGQTTAKILTLTDADLEPR